jgi:hypothetical protein
MLTPPLKDCSNCEEWLVFPGLALAGGGTSLCRINPTTFLVPG